MDARVVAALSWTRAASNERKFPWCLRGRRQRSESVDAPIVVALSWTRAARGESVDAPVILSRERGRLQIIPSGARVDRWMESQRGHELENFMSLVSTCYHHMCSAVRFQ